MKALTSGLSSVASVTQRVVTLDAGRAKATKYTFEVSHIALVSGLSQGEESTGLIMQFGRGLKLVATKVKRPNERVGRGVSWGLERLNFVATIYESKSGKRQSKAYTVTLLNQKFKELASAEIDLTSTALTEGCEQRRLKLKRVGGSELLTLEFTISARRMKGKAALDDDDTDSMASSIPTIDSGDTKDRAEALEQDLDGFSELPPLRTSASSLERFAGNSASTFKKTPRGAQLSDADPHEDQTLRRSSDMQRERAVVASALGKPPSAAAEARTDARRYWQDGHSDAEAAPKVLGASVERSSQRSMARLNSVPESGSPAEQSSSSDGIEERIAAARAMLSSDVCRQSPTSAAARDAAGGSDEAAHENKWFTVEAQTAGELAASAVGDIDDLGTMNRELSEMGKALMGLRTRRTSNIEPDDSTREEELWERMGPSHDRLDSATSAAVYTSPYMSSLSNHIEDSARPPAAEDADDEEEDPALARARAIIQFSQAQQAAAIAPAMAATAAVGQDERQRAQVAEAKVVEAEAKMAEMASEAEALRLERNQLQRRVLAAEAVARESQVELDRLRAQMDAEALSGKASGPAAVRRVEEAKADDRWRKMLIEAKLSAAQFAFERDEARAELRRGGAAGRKRNVRRGGSTPAEPKRKTPNETAAAIPSSLPSSWSSSKMNDLNEMQEIDLR